MAGVGVVDGLAWAVSLGAAVDGDSDLVGAGEAEDGPGDGDVVGVGKAEDGDGDGDVVTPTVAAGGGLTSR